MDENSVLTLSCTVRANPAPEIVWLKRSEEAFTVILNTTRTSITSVYRHSDATTISSLRVTAAEANDEGEYFCEARNEVMPTNVTLASKMIGIRGKYLAINNMTKSSMFVISHASMTVNNKVCPILPCTPVILLLL